MTSCPTRGGEPDIEFLEVAVSDYFVIGSRPRAGRENDAGWLEWIEEDRVWRRVPNNRGGNAWYGPPEGVQFYGMRLFNIDRDMNFRNASRRDISEWDGIRFRYRSSTINTEPRMLDCRFWWAYASERDFPAWNWENGFANPCPELGWREVFIPWHRMWRWGIPQGELPCNDTTKFNPNHWRGMRVDGRTTAQDGMPIWLEVVDFAFFRYR